MTHIANCMRASAMGKGQVYLSDEMSSGAITVSLGLDSLVCLSIATSPDFADPTLPSTSTRKGAPKYQLWPSSSSKSPTYQTRPTFAQEKAMALSVKRSATAMGDAIVTADASGSRNRHGSISRRRKVSVPELQPPPPMTTLRENCMDSPTIPGRPPIARPVYETTHERSPSAPVQPGAGWRANPFGDAMTSCITGPAPVAAKKPLSPLSQGTEPTQEVELNLPLLRPLSPILSPTTTEKPKLQANTNVPAADDDGDIPPAVPPKSPSLFKKSPIFRQQARNDSGVACAPINEVPPMPTKPVTGNADCSSPEALQKGEIRRIHSRKCSEERPKPTEDKHKGLRKMWSDQSLIDRGRPVARSQRLPHSRKGSSTSSSEKDNGDTWKLPRGLPTTEAATKYPTKDRERLRTKASSQAEKFEVLTSRDVNSLTKELEALDERCEYLRRTYKSLREGRQKLHTRMISYLKRSDAVVFSRENLLKQEEALIELDLSIDDWTVKIEQAENRRHRIRHKLLEHVAAAVTLPQVPYPGGAAEATPPRSPVKDEKADSPPPRIERKDVESIKIYADGDVLSLFSDIEQAIGRMCEHAE
ncbi:uncharacterized protein K452DRAFT_229100 [Aplosporella prunicola CBS 121167]|uniref:Up-regulated during septation protein 1 domain-containing protein n=1 Tax=Aplosporella prunicola CBS 121167 TaxID=1176127 RepID=A0A6A6BEK5_9PEZI|nr:uncharacterized protein K452DRAFT_229100 [Aplosporella prunicola CBS 121167]KAF2141357.1 hypothetical protein K452DRAFT_229100 [Aplosporella prunicola CBS 121167]